MTIPSQKLLGYLSERVILVTGASSGIGRAVAKAYAKEGAEVILLARNITQLESLYDEIKTSGGKEPIIYPFNLSNATQNDYETLQQNIEKNFGRLDGLLLNAASVGSLTPIEHYSAIQWFQILQLNLNSAFLLSQVTLPLLKRSIDASIIFTTIDDAHKTKAYWGAYAVSKCGCETLMKILSEELQNTTAIRVNSIDPGKVRTKLRLSIYPAEDPATLKRPEEILDCYLYLMGPDAKGVTGQHFKAQEYRLNEHF